MNIQKYITLIILLIAGIIFSVGMTGSLLKNAVTQPADELPNFILGTRIMICLAWIVMGSWGFLLIKAAYRENERLNIKITTLESANGIVNSLSNSLEREIKKGRTVEISPLRVLSILRNKIKSCVKNNNIEELQNLLDNLTIDKEGDITAAWLLVFKTPGTEEVMDFLWHKNYVVDVNLQGENDDTAAHIAMRHGNWNYLYFLKNLEADFTITNKVGKTPLDYLQRDMTEALHNLLPAEIIEKIYPNSQLANKETPDENLPPDKNAK